MHELNNYKINQSVFLLFIFSNQYSMTKEQEYIKLKDLMFEAYSRYISTIMSSDYNDLHSFEKRFPLLDTYIKTVETNAAFREFIIKNSHTLV